jgi:hypothetical protein
MTPYTNSFFSNTTGYSGETLLLDDLCREQIKMFGVDILYMPRRILNYDKLLHEGTKSAFEFALPIPMYIKSFSGFQNGMELLTKFGLRDSSELTLTMSRSEWTAYYAPFVKSYYNAINERPPTDVLNFLEGETAQRPKEGDVIYFPFDDSLFEVKYVNSDEQFFQLGKGYTFDLQVERFEYSGEEFDTNYIRPDDVQVLTDYYQLQFQMFKDADNIGTFKFNERVSIFNLTEYPLDTTIDGGLAAVYQFFRNVNGGTADIFVNPDNLRPNEIIFSADGGTALGEPTPKDQQPFSLFKDPGYSNKVPVVYGSVKRWDKPGGILWIDNLTDLDPDEQDDFGNVNQNDFDKVVVIGQESGATWYSFKATEKPMAFNDSMVIQEEFDKIHVLDPADQNPFGFV